MLYGLFCYVSAQFKILFAHIFALHLMEVSAPNGIDGGKRSKRY